MRNGCDLLVHYSIVTSHTHQHNLAENRADGPGAPHTDSLAIHLLPYKPRKGKVAELHSSFGLHQVSAIDGRTTQL